jgi:VanZ family protein
VEWRPTSQESDAGRHSGARPHDAVRRFRKGRGAVGHVLPAAAKRVAPSSPGEDFALAVGMSGQTIHSPESLPASGSGDPLVLYREPDPGSLGPVWGLWLAYVFFVVYATALPFDFSFDPDVLALKVNWINWDPTHLKITGEPTPISDLVANVLFFVPLGFLGVFLQRGRSGVRQVFVATLTGFVLSLGVETLQFFTPTRNPATSDLICNTAGALLGAWVAVFFAHHVRTQMQDRLSEWARREPRMLLLAGMVVLEILRAVIPLNVAIAVNLLKKSVRSSELAVDWASLASWQTWAQNLEIVLINAVLGGLLFLVLGNVQRRGNRVMQGMVAFVVVAMMAVALEIAQLFILSRVTSTTDALMGIVGGGIGIVVAACLRATRRARYGWRVVLVAWCLALAARSLAPFTFQLDAESLRAKFQHLEWLPYLSHYFKATLEAVHEFLEDLLLYLPLGFLFARFLAVQHVRRSTKLALGAALLCATWAIFLEGAQLGLPGRYVDISDVITAALAGVLGGFAWAWFAQLSNDELANHRTNIILMVSDSPSD